MSFAADFLKETKRQRDRGAAFTLQMAFSVTRSSPLTPFKDEASSASSLRTDTCLD